MSSLALEELKTFHIEIKTDQSPGTTTELSDLLEEKQCFSFLEKQRIAFHAPSIPVAASMFSKRYAHLVVASTLYSMAVYNGAFHLPVKACSLSEDRKLCIRQELCPWEEARHLDREPWRKKVLGRLFMCHLTPIFHILEKNSRLPASILWENAATRMNSVYRKILTSKPGPVVEERLYNDFCFLKETDGTLFQLAENPLAPYLKIEENLELPQRKTCCLYYTLEKETEDLRFCRNCPTKSRRYAD
ncbi:IucA/IucC family C-terminal-domain containing protein [Bacillus piscicola]|uniref:IucA/IucC family C-terminal-domain containing protein n=1 Tax=Bacillus piscicola TaxID=1632684 RepID=UPI001F09D406|nr:IucA/IucC family C-terminal-domain containing protein [Bacillus piscicola]